MTSPHYEVLDRALTRWAAGDIPEATRLLGLALRDADADVRKRAADALGNPAAADHGGVELLLQVVGDADSRVRQRAWRSFGKIGREACSARQLSAIRTAWVARRAKEDETVRMAMMAAAARIFVK